MANGCQICLARTAWSCAGQSAAFQLTAAVTSRSFLLAMRLFSRLLAALHVLDSFRFCVRIYSTDPTVTVL